MTQPLDIRRGTGFLLVFLLDCLWSTVQASDDNGNPDGASSDPKHETNRPLYLEEQDGEPTLTGSKVISS